MAKELQIPPGYAAVLTEIKERVRPAQVRASFAVSRELVLLHGTIGRVILVRQDAEGWGTKVIERLAKDLGVEFPGVEGFSPRNLKYMRSLAEAWPGSEIVPQLVALLPRGHLRVLVDRLKDRETREWYLRAAVEYGWSRNILVNQISSRLHEREGKELREFISRMVAENPTWGAPRIHGELKMLGFDLSGRTVLRWMRKASRRPEAAKRWVAFLSNNRDAEARRHGQESSTRSRPFSLAR
jgi:predicted nuclease of restriction endonuclease-like (RecB) superfamily